MNGGLGWTGVGRGVGDWENINVDELKNKREKVETNTSNRRMSILYQRVTRKVPRLGIPRNVPIRLRIIQAEIVIIRPIIPNVIVRFALEAPSLSAPEVRYFNPPKIIIAIVIKATIPMAEETKVANTISRSLMFGIISKY